MKANILKLFALLFITLASLTFTGKVSAQAATINQPMVSLTFDDGFLTTYTNALPILSAHNMVGTIFPTAKFIDQGFTDDGFAAMNWTQLQSLQNDYGWEIGGHTYDHPLLTTQTPTQVDTELATSNSEYTAHGLNVTNFASPYGDYNNSVLTEVLKYYYSHRGFADQDSLDSFPYNRAVLTVKDVLDTTTLSTMEGWVDQAKSQNTWLILVFHDVQAQNDPNYEYTITNANLTALTDYIKNSGIPVKTVDQAEKIPGINILSNSGFESGLTNWTTDNAAQVTLDTNNNGNYPSANNSVKVAGSSSSNHLFSDLYKVDPSSKYLLESFVNTTNLISGESGFYIDEYDAAGNWISGQWLGLVVNNTVGFFDKLYQATSSLVSQIRTQVYITANAVGSMFADNTTLTNLDAVASSPSPTPSASPSATPSASPSATPSASVSVNLAPNFSFEQLTNGWANSWTKDDNSISIDTNSRGTDATNSAHIQPNSAYAHLISSQFSVDPTVTYNWGQDIVNQASGSGEFGFYIDEYDTTGSWISGQWKTAIKSAYDGFLNIVYKPTSNLVKLIDLQYYVTPGSTFNFFLDNVRFSDSTQPSPTPTATPSPSPTASPSATPTPTPSGSPSPTPTPTPTPNNLVPNFSFEVLTTGWANFWTKDSDNFTIDTSSQGNDGANSLHLSPNIIYSHAFSAQIPVDASANYVWSQFVKATSTGTGELGFYIDEYDSTGNWISGQWKGAIFGNSNAGIIQFNYIPTSSNVSLVRLQFYAVPNSTLDVFLDSISLTKI